MDPKNDKSKGKNKSSETHMEPAPVAAPETTSAVQPTAAPVASAPTNGRAKLSDEQKQARKKARLESSLAAMNQGTKTAPEMNVIGKRARSLHRAIETFEEMSGLSSELETTRKAAIDLAKAQRDAAISEWTSHDEKRRGAGVGNDPSMKPLGLMRDEKSGAWTWTPTQRKKSEEE